jgi:hypothetical protein
MLPKHFDVAAWPVVQKFPEIFRNHLQTSISFAQIRSDLKDPPISTAKWTNDETEDISSRGS